MLIQGTDEWKRLHWVWAEMLSRCRNPNHKAFANYGGRGIAVCQGWREFSTFLSDMGERPAGALIDRVDNDGPYEPANCRWATRQQQNSNRRNCIYAIDRGEAVTLRELCRRRGLPYRPIVKRIRDRGWPVELAVALPLGSRIR